MKKNQLIKLALLIFLLIGLSGCASKKKKKCDTCPKWSYITSVSMDNLI